MARLAIGVDIGATAIRVIAGSEKKGVFRVEKWVTVPLAEDEETDPAAAGAELATALKEAGVAGAVRAGLTGRDVVIRYTQVPPVPDWQLRKLMDFEVKELVEQSGEPLAADFNVIPVASDVGSDDTVMLALAKPAILANHGAVLEAAGLKLQAFTPNPVALFNAWKKSSTDEGTTLILHVGARNSDVTIIKNGDLLFARNLSGGGELFDEALAASFGVGKPKSRQLKHDLADVSPPDPAQRKASSPQAEKVSRALAGAVGQLFSMVQSSVMFAKSQTGQNEVKLDRVLLSGGGSLLKGLDRYLEQNLGVPVKRFIPFEAVEFAAGAELEDAGERSRATVALGLAMTSAFADAYSLDVMPESAKKARAFRERTVFSILAGLIAVIALGLYAVRTKTDHEAASKDLTAHVAEANKLNKRKREGEEKLLLRDESTKRLVMLEEHTVNGVGLTRCLALLQKYLPADLYVTTVTTPRVKSVELGIAGEPRPVLVVEGEGREGAQALAATFNRFAEEIGKDPMVPVKPVSTVSAAAAKKPFEWTLTFNFSKPTATDAPAEPQ